MIPLGHFLSILLEPLFLPGLSTSFPCSALYRCSGVRRMSPSNRLGSLTFRFSAKQSGQCRGPVRGFLLSLIPVTLRTDIPRMLAPLKSGTAQREGMWGGGGGGGGAPRTCPPPASFVRYERKKKCFPIHGREKRRYNCSWRYAITIVIVKAIKKGVQLIRFYFFGNFVFTRESLSLFRFNFFIVSKFYIFVVNKS